MLNFKEKYDIMKGIDNIPDITYLIDVLAHPSEYGEFEKVAEKFDCAELNELWRHLLYFRKQLRSVIEENE